MSPSENGSPRVVKFAELEFTPRFAFPQMCEVVEVAGLKDRSELSGGFARFKNAEIPWQVRYDELILVLEGEFSVDTPNGRITAGPRDTIWLPNGTPVTYVSENALVFYSIQPASWASEVVSA